VKVLRGHELQAMGRVVDFGGGGISNRFLLESDSMGYTITRTVVPPAGPQHWHYPCHLESCYCVSGKGVLTDLRDGTTYDIRPDTLYALDAHDDHTFEAVGVEPVVLLCVFNPPLLGTEDHKGAGYSAGWRSPTYDVRAVPISKVVANDYNPNKVAPPEMELLETSIWEDGFTQPVVTVYDPDEDMYVVVDGFHRYLVIRDSQRIRDRERGLIPVVVLDKSVGDRMASTIRHNRARGSHNIELMSQIVTELVEMGKGDRWICTHIGMSPDELLRMKQITGLASLFANTDFGEAWEADTADGEFADVPA